MRSQEINIDYWPDYCSRVFGEDLPANHAEKTNKVYGGLNITGKNIFFANSQEDPWQWAGMRELTNPNTTQSAMTA